jgi:peptidase S46-like protein
VALLGWGLAPPLAAGEGMWTFDNPPAKLLEEQFSFTPTAEWLDRLRLASVRFMDGGSGAFVSPDGLMITNHHVGAPCIQNLSTNTHDYVSRGFLAASRAEEPPCPGYEVNVLVKTEDVTSRVRGAVTAVMSDSKAANVRQAAAARIEADCNRGGRRCEVVALYGGGEYHLYQYRKYTDVRLVFAPEEQVAFFGGDPDNFTFPRHDLDVAFFRAYENGRPARPASYLKWSQAGAADGELVFTSGHPGAASRLSTLAQLESERDVELPARLAFIKQRREALLAYAARGPEEARRANDAIRSIENNRKSRSGQLASLRDPRGLARKAAEEAELRAKVASDPALARAIGDPWSAIAAARKKADARVQETRFVDFAGAETLALAGRIVLLASESKKRNEVRLLEFRDSGRASLKNALYSPAPIYDDLEEATLADQLAQAQAALGPDHPFVRAALQRQSPAEAAKALLAGTRLQSVAVRKALVEGGEAAIKGSRDRMILFARRVEPLYRDVRRFREEEYDAVVTRAAEKLAAARFKVYGRSVYPDATFTLRLGYGTVKGYLAEGTEVPPRTTFHGLFDRSLAFGGHFPWSLPERWIERQGALDLTTPLNFVSTNDIIGGSSGSPVVNRAGELVGIVFDGNIHNLAGDFFFDEEKNRAVSVDARAVREALRKVYEADALVRELLGS